MRLKCVSKTDGGYTVVQERNTLKLLEIGLPLWRREDLLGDYDPRQTVEDLL